MARALPPSRLRSSTALGVAWAIVVLDLVVLGQAWRSIVVDRANEYERAGRSAQGLARVLGESLDGILRQIDLALLSTVEEVEQAHDGDAAHDVDGYITRLASRLPFLDAIRTANPQGIVDHGVGQGSGQPVDVGDRDYFLRAKGRKGLIVSAPLISRVTGRRSIAFSRQTLRKDGSFGGIAYAVLSLDRLAAVLTAADVGRSGVVELRDRELGLVARNPEPLDSARSVGEREYPPELEQAIAAGRLEATFRALGPRDGKERVMALRTLSGGAFHLAVGLSPDEFLAGWRVATRQSLAAALAFVVLTILAGRRLLRSWSREIEARFRTLVDDAPIAIALAHGTQIDYVNREYVRQFGLQDAEAAIGRSLLASVAPDDAARAAERIERRMHSLPVEPTLELTLLRPDGSAFKAAVTDATIGLAAGRIFVGFIQDVTERRRSEEERERLISELKTALAEVKTLGGLLPICAHCKKIRDDRGYWNRIETFIRERSTAEFTHSICPECAERYYSDVLGGGPNDGEKP